MPEAWILLHSTGWVLLLHSINRVRAIANLESESETKKKSLHPHVHTQPWQRQSRKQAKMTQKHIQAKANMDKLCQTRQNQCSSPIKKKQHNLGVRFEPFPLLEFSPPLESCSDIYAGSTSCLIVTPVFNVLFLWYFPLFYLPSLSIYSRSANIRPLH